MMQCFAKLFQEMFLAYQENWARARSDKCAHLPSCSALAVLTPLSGIITSGRRPCEVNHTFIQCLSSASMLVEV